MGPLYFLVISNICNIFLPALAADENICLSRNPETEPGLRGLFLSRRKSPSTWGKGFKAAKFSRNGE
jgi:hypothetical protein